MSTTQRLGQLSVLQHELSRPARTSRLWLSMPLLAIAAAALVLTASGWLPWRFVPSKIVLRGCSLTSAPDVLDALGYGAGESIFSLWRCTRDFQPDTTRWIKGVTVAPSWSRLALISVTERHPLLYVSAGEAEYWLCDDGMLVAVAADVDNGGVFDGIARLPGVVLHDDPGSVAPPQADDLLLTAACCREAVPGIIVSIEVGPGGEFVLYEKSGLPIRLGLPISIPEKIGALQEALDICGKDSAGLKYLDASNPDVFYEKWSTPQ